MDHVHDHFVTWFMWGFCSFIPMIVCLPIPAIGSCLSVCANCSLMAWWIAGMVWRLRTSGKFASGDVNQLSIKNDEEWIASISGENSFFQVESGRFIYIYLLITWIFWGVGCGCGIIGGIIGMIAACCKH